MRVSAGEHISEDDLEMYAMGRIGDLETGPIEEHLLVCEECQDSLAATDELIRALRGALKEGT